jgi:hypothetical protein
MCLSCIPIAISDPGELAGQHGHRPAEHVRGHLAVGDVSKAGDVAVAVDMGDERHDRFAAVELLLDGRASACSSESEVLVQR